MKKNKSLKEAVQKTEEPPKQVQLFSEIIDLKGRYANDILVISQEKEITLDFLSSVKSNGGFPSVSLVSRVFLHRDNAQNLLVALNQILNPPKRDDGTTG